VSHLDGNVLAGPLSELFSTDMTAAVGRCLGCADESALACARVYPDAMGYVVRCRRCGDVLMTLVAGPGDVRVEMRGMAMLRVPGEPVTK
jgi:ribosomal protein S27E